MKQENIEYFRSIAKTHPNGKFVCVGGSPKYRELTNFKGTLFPREYDDYVGDCLSMIGDADEDYWMEINEWNEKFGQRPKLLTYEIAHTLPFGTILTVAEDNKNLGLVKGSTVIFKGVEGHRGIITKDDVFWKPERFLAPEQVEFDIPTLERQIEQYQLQIKNMQDIQNEIDRLNDIIKSSRKQEYTRKLNELNKEYQDIIIR